MTGNPSQAQQQQEPSEQIEDLALHHLGDAAQKAGVAEAAGAEFAGTSTHGNARLLIRPAMAHKGKRFHGQAAQLKGLADQSATEVFAMAITQQENRPGITVVIQPFSQACTF